MIWLSCTDQIFIPKELNVRKVTVSSDKERYGVKLQAEADFRALGARLKGEVKAVVAALKELGDEQLTKFQREGSMEVRGHVLTSSDVHLKYALDTDKKKSSAAYEAHSDGQVSRGLLHSILGNALYHVAIQ